MFNKQTFGSTPSTSSFGGFGGTPTGATPFGQNTFNKPVAATTGFQSTGFGNTGGSMFGATTATSNTGLFGATSTPAFGQQQQQQTTAFSGFNSGGSAPLFGSTSGGGFAQPKPAFGGFGTTTQSTGLFGAQPTASPATSGASIFNGQSSSLFGGASGFGNTVATNNVVGTPIKFNPLAGTDTMVKNNQTTTISTRHQCITCMKEYENKSLEELRLEDLQAGRKGPQQGGGIFGPTGQAAQPSLFGSSTIGQPTSTGFGENKSLFGATPTSNAGLGGFGTNTTAFGVTATNTGIFGKPTGFGTATPASTATTGFSFANNNNNNSNIFGGTAAQKPFGGGNVFGAQTQPTSLFGATPTTNTGFAGFGAQQQQQQTQQQGLSLFSQNKPANSPFGIAAPQPAAQTGFGFNQTPATSTQSVGLFGNKPTLGTGLSSFGNTNTSPFGNKPLGAAAPAFGTPFGAQQPATSLTGGTSLFGQNTLNKPPGTAPTSFGFGSQPTSSFGTGLSGGATLFGNKPAAPTNLFGATTGTGLFNNNATATGTNMFGNNTSFGTGSLNLGQTPSLNLNANKPFGSFGTLGNQSSLGAPQGPSAHQNIMNLVSYPYGDQPLFRNLPNEKVEELRMKATNPAAQKAALAQSSPSFTLSSSASPRLTVKPPLATPAKTSLFEGLETSIPGASGASPFKNLAAAITPKSSIKLLKLRPDANSSNSSLIAAQTPEKAQPAPTTPTWAASSKFRDIIPGSTPTSSTPKNINGKPDKDQANESCDDLDATLADVRPARKLALEESHGPLNATDASILLSDISEVPEEDAQTEEVVPHPAGILLRRGGYYTVPSLEELAKLYEETQRCEVSNFTIGRLNYGNIYFDEPMDIAGLNLDEIVHIRHREVVVYPNDDTKPPLGQGLNRKAQVTLDRIYPTNKQTRAPIKDVDTIINMDYDTTLRKACYKMKARFVEYIPDSGSWVFKVEHFSKYGLPDDSDDDEDMTVADISKARPPAQVPVPPKPPVIMPAKQPQVPVKPHSLSDTHTTFNTSQTFPYIETMEEDYSEILSPNEQIPQLTGMDTSKIRLMKASFFQMEVPENEEKMVEDEFVFEKPQTVIRDVDHEMTLAVPEKEARPSRPHQKPIIVTSKFMPFPSLMSQKLNNCLADSALYQGHCAKTSWAVNGSIVATEDQLVSLTCPYLASDIKKETLEKHMSIQLNLTTSHADDGPVPRLSPQDGQDLLVAHCELVKNLTPGSEKERMARQVLLLCHTLWGELPSSVESTPAIISNARRKATCDWLQTVICEEEMANPTQLTSPEQKIMQQLSQGKLLECVNDCQEAGDHSLSLIVASSGSLAVTKTMFQQQVLDWVSVRISGFINEDRLKAYVMCGAGQPLLTQEDGETLNALQGLSWLSALAAHAWYLCSPAASVPDILSKYESSFLEQPYFAAAPIPPGGTEVYLDVRYQLLKLFSQRTYPLEGLLSVETHYPESPLDFSLSWLLLTVLDSLHYTHVSEHCSQNLHLMFAEQLEAVGLWHWSVFVLLHIANPAMRYSAVEQIILRHVLPNSGGSPKSLSHKEEFIISKLGVPAKMIYSAKAVHMLDSSKYLDLAHYHFYAEEWDQCYKTLITNLAADAIISDEFKATWELLKELQLHSHEITHWHEHGQVYYSYLNLREDLESMKFQSAEDKLEAITQKVVSVCTQIRHMPCNSPKERLCQSEMAFKLFELARALIMANRNRNKSVSEDYRLRELENVMRFVYQNDDPPKNSK